jgi:hypothetical protein
MVTKDLKDGSIVITDVMGRVQQMKPIHKYSSLMQLDISHLAAGNYFIRVQMKEGVKAIPFIKQ